VITAWSRHIADLAGHPAVLDLHTFGISPSRGPGRSRYSSLSGATGPRNVHHWAALQVRGRGLDVPFDEHDLIAEIIDW